MIYEIFPLEHDNDVEWVRGSSKSNVDMEVINTEVLLSGSSSNDRNDAKALKQVRLHAIKTRREIEMEKKDKNMVRFVCKCTILNLGNNEEAKCPCVVYCSKWKCDINWMRCRHVVATKSSFSIRNPPSSELHLLRNPLLTPECDEPIRTPTSEPSDLTLEFLSWTISHDLYQLSRKAIPSGMPRTLRNAHNPRIQKMLAIPESERASEQWV
uniref:Uncharacterized protein n=1 Tax=Lactuca sativa TaxID=4236 RepID=A0A9R1VZZ5_LACSA|nr:hypothetical protein LSAT_V11C400189360 [Lactuca sativa]